MKRRVLPLVLLLVAVPAACQSTQDESRELEAEGGKRFSEKGLDVKRRNPDVQVLATRVLQDANGTAAVVVMRSRAAAPLRRVPVQIQVNGKGGKQIFSNDEPGLDPSLTGPAVLPPDEELAWVHDQVVAEGRATGVDATPGPARGSAAGKLPELKISSPRLEGDSASGLEATGSVTNASEVEQRELVLYCVGRRAGKIIAAGRGAIPRLKPGQRLPYHIFFIGDPRDTRLTVAAPPTVLEQGVS